MCHVCARLRIVIERPSTEQLAREAAEEEAREEAEIHKREQELAQGKLTLDALRKQRKQRPTPTPPTKVVVEPAPSHDGTPTVAAYEVPVEDPQNQNQKHRPPFSIRIYDTTANATADRAARLAQRISELTYNTRYSDRCYGKDRIEVIAMPMPESTTAEERGAKCVAHNEAESATRLLIADPAIATSWFIVEDFKGYCFKKSLFLIDELKDSWEDALRSPERADPLTRSIHGQFRCVSFGRAFYDDEDEDLQGKEIYVGKELALETLADQLADFRGNAPLFYKHHFIPEGVLDMQLALARAAAAGVEMPRPVMIPYKPTA